MGRVAERILLSEEEVGSLTQWLREGSGVPWRRLERARIIWLAIQGKQNQEIARELGISRPTVQLWRKRFLARRLAGLEDAPRSGRAPRIPAAKVKAVIEATLHRTPPNAAHWAARTMAAAQGVSAATVRRIWQQHSLNPRLVKRSMPGRDKPSAAKLYDVAGLYLNPPDKALVFCVDEMTETQVPARTRPLLSQRSVIPRHQTREYKRDGTRLLAALNLLDGMVIGDRMRRHRHLEFIRFLKQIDVEVSGDFALHLIVEDRGTHKLRQVKSWLERHPRFHLHLTPTSGPWLNMVKRWLCETMDKRMRQGSFGSVGELTRAIGNYTAAEQNARVFTWATSFYNENEFDLAVADQPLDA